MLYDAVVNDPIGQIREEDEAVLRSASPSPQWQVSFLPIMCPQCGWDLKGSRNSTVFTCDNCFTAWETYAGKLRQTRLLVVPAENNNAAFLPFWKINATCPSLGIESFADLVRLEKPLMPREECPDLEATFIVPAFKIAPRMFLSMAQRLTTTQHNLPEAEAGINKSIACAVTLPRDEAVQSIKIILAYGAFNKAEVFTVLPDVEVQVKDTALVFLPFNDSGYELSTQYGVQASIVKQSLELVSSLSENNKAEPKMIAMNCPLCDKETPAGSTHCPYCGIKL